jgi:Mg-chelatase subunit ChlD
MRLIFDIPNSPEGAAKFVDQLRALGKNPLAKAMLSQYGIFIQE